MVIRGMFLFSKGELDTLYLPTAKQTKENKTKYYVRVLVKSLSFADHCPQTCVINM